MSLSLPSDSCSSNNSGCSNEGSYPKGKTVEQCRQEAKKNSVMLAKEIEELGQISWMRVLDSEGHDEVVYKLAL